MNSDVLIIGGGIIGLAIARELYKKGARKITILERGAVGKEASHAAAGMLAPHAETDRLDDFFFFCDESNKLYPNFAEELFEELVVSSLVAPTFVRDFPAETAPLSFVPAECDKARQPLPELLPRPGVYPIFGRIAL